MRKMNLKLCEECFIPIENGNRCEDCNINIEEITPVIYVQWKKVEKVVHKEVIKCEKHGEILPEGICSECVREANQGIIRKCGNCGMLKIPGDSRSYNNKHYYSQAVELV